MGKKRVLFVTRRMIMGGIEKSLISLLEELPADKFEVTVLVMGKDGELEREFPNDVSLQCIFGEEKTSLEKVKNNVIKLQLIGATKVAVYSLLAKVTKNVFKKELYYSKMLPILENEYDLAVAYHTPASFPVVYVINNVKAKKKVAWIHSDVSQYTVEMKPYERYYFQYDNIYCVSKFALNKFIEMYPSMEDKTEVFYNIINLKKINNLSLKCSGFRDEFKGIRILTVGRLTEQKGQDIIPEIVSKIVASGINIRWYCIGDGEKRKELEEKVTKFGFQDKIILLGNQNNPYPYYRECDIYVQPSRHEGYCITLAEARAFEKPIITTDFVGAREQIIDGETGFITSFNEELISQKIINIIEDKTISNNFINNLSRIKIENKSVLEDVFY